MQVAVGRGDHADIGMDHRVLPRRMNSRSSRTRSSLAWTVGAISPTHRETDTPPAACSMRPGLVDTAPVNAPRS
jgi:hypothetical protein